MQSGFSLSYEYIPVLLSDFMKAATLLMCYLVPLFIPCPPQRALTHGPVTLAGSLRGRDHLKTSSASLPPPPYPPFLPSCLGHTTPRMINRSQWEVWTLTSQKTLETESRGAELLRLLTLVGWTPCLLGCEKLLEGLKDALSCQGRLVGCCLLNSITSHFKSQLLLNVLYQHVIWDTVFL